jgi:hypothetical protein
MTTPDDESYDLFRRAIVEGDADAWASIHGRFRPMLIGWADRTGVRSDHGLDCIAIADQAFARAWAALTPERFADFPTVGRLLSYLRTCVATTVIDGIRQQTSYWQALPEELPAIDSLPEQLVLAKMERTALWSIVRSAALTQAEWVALVESYAYHLPPRAIHARNPHLFASVADVYRAKRNLINRLQRNPELGGWCAERAA